ncbi:MAG: hypothetical protein IKG87_15150 [Clostridia bacterium]|nr:hypothetical protein [Clostridia bacterium]
MRYRENKFSIVIDLTCKCSRGRRQFFAADPRERFDHIPDHNPVRSGRSERR